MLSQLPAVKMTELSVSDVDPDDLAEMMKGIDDLDDDLFGKKITERPSKDAPQKSVLKSSQQEVSQGGGGRKVFSGFLSYVGVRGLNWRTSFSSRPSFVAEFASPARIWGLNCKTLSNSTPVFCRTHIPCEYSGTQLEDVLQFYTLFDC